MHEELDIYVPTWINLKNRMCGKSNLWTEIHEMVLLMSRVSPHETSISLNTHTKGKNVAPLGWRSPAREEGRPGSDGSSAAPITWCCLEKDLKNIIKCSHFINLCGSFSSVIFSVPFYRFDMFHNWRLKSHKNQVLIINHPCYSFWGLKAPFGHGGHRPGWGSVPSSTGRGVQAHCVISPRPPYLSRPLSSHLRSEAWRLDEQFLWPLQPRCFMTLMILQVCRHSCHAGTHGLSLLSCSL